MKKVITWALIILAVTIIAVGGTYAFFKGIAVTNTISLKGHKLEVIYRGDTEISGNLDLVKRKEEGYRRVVNIGLSENSVEAVANIFIYIESITPNLAVEGLKWEIYKIEEDEEIYMDSGTFLDCGKKNEPKAKCTSGENIYMVTNYELTRTQTEFAIYIWLNGYEVDNNVLNGMLKGYIAAETENITGQIS